MPDAVGEGLARIADSAKGPVLEAVGLRKHYPGAAAPAVADAMLRVAAGGFVSIVGRSGSGKSTLLAMLGGLARPSAGRVLLRGTDIWALNDAARATVRRSRIAGIRQQAGLLPGLRAADNVALPALLGGTPAAEADAAARAMLRRVGLAHRLDAHPGELSGGEERRVAIARALVGAPDVLLADEPTGDLDAATEATIVALVEALRQERGFALVLVTHNEALAARASVRLVMDQGRLVEAWQAPLPPPAAATAETPPVPLGAGLRRRALGVGAAALALMATAGVADRVAAARQADAAQRRAEREAALERAAIAGLRTDIAAVRSLGGGRYEVALYLERVPTGEDRRSLLVMAPRVEAFVQDGLDWAPLPLTPLAAATALVRELPPGRQVFRYGLEARPARFTPLLRHYMHLRFRQELLVRLGGEGGDAAPFRRVDNIYIHLKPHDANDAAILRDVRFPESPPLWIWMPPH